MACVARAARGSFVTILQFLLIRNAAEELNKFHYNYAYFHFLFYIFIFGSSGRRPLQRLTLIFLINIYNDQYNKI